MIDKNPSVTDICDWLRSMGFGDAVISVVSDSKPAGFQSYILWCRKIDSNNFLERISFFTDKLSQRLRHVRWLRKKRSTGDESGSTNIARKKKYSAPIISTFEELPNSDESTSYDDACAELKDLYKTNSADVPRIMRLLRVTFSERRKFITNLSNGDVTNIVQLFPHLQLPKYIANEFDLLKPDVSKLTKDNWELTIKRLRTLLVDNEDTTKTQLNLILQLQNTLSIKGQSGKHLSCVTVLENKDFNQHSAKKEPPRLVIVVGEDDQSSFIFCDGLVIELSPSSPGEIRDQAMTLIFSYYAWGLNYPKHFQLLPFMQEYVLLDTDGSIFKSTAYSKFNMKFQIVKARNK